MKKTCGFVGEVLIGRKDVVLEDGLNSHGSWPRRDSEWLASHWRPTCLFERTYDQPSQLDIESRFMNYHNVRTIDATLPLFSLMRKATSLPAITSLATSDLVWPE